MDKFIGKKKIKETKETEERTPGGIIIDSVEFEDGTIERFSRIMIDRIITEESIDESALRDKRIMPVVEMVLSVLREWGIKTGELPYLSALLNKSLDFNSNQALITLLSSYMPKPNSLDDLDLITIDRILKDATPSN